MVLVAAHHHRQEVVRAGRRGDVRGLGVRGQLPGHVRRLRRPHGQQEQALGGRRLAAVRISAADTDFAALVERYASILGAVPMRRGVLPVGDARLEVVRGPVTRLEAMTIAVGDLAHARRTAGAGGHPAEATEAGFSAGGLFFEEVA